mgnify:FL=1
MRFLFVARFFFAFCRMERGLSGFYAFEEASALLAVWALP